MVPRAIGTALELLSAVELFLLIEETADTELNKFGTWQETGIPDPPHDLCMRHLLQERNFYSFLTALRDQGVAIYPAVPGPRTRQ